MSGLINPASHDLLFPFEGYKKQSAACPSGAVAPERCHCESNVPWLLFLNNLLESLCPRSAESTPHLNRFDIFISVFLEILNII